MNSQTTNTINPEISESWNKNINEKICSLKSGDSKMKSEKVKNSDSTAAIVTGASSGIGKEISKVLCDMGYKVYGLGRNFEQDDLSEDLSKDKSENKNENKSDGKLENNSKVKPEIISKTISEENFRNSEEGITQISCDLLDTNNTIQIIKKIKKENTVKILVNCAGVGYYGLHEEINYKNIQEMVRTNLELPMILSSELLRDLKKNNGYIINISSITAENSNPHGCAYGATKAGLASFSKSLFDEQRKYGVKVVNIQPDMTRTNLYRNADFRESDNEAAFLYPREVAEAVRQILSCRDGMVVTEITIRPQLHQIKKNK